MKETVHDVPKEKATAEQVAKYNEDSKQAQIRLREQEYQQTLKERIAVVIDSWDNLDCPDERRAIKRYLNDNAFYRKVNTIFMVTKDEPI